MTRSMLSVVFGRGVRLAAAGVIAMAMLGLGAVPAAAVTPGATILVNTTLDDGSAGNCELREAIEAANTNTAVDLCTAGTTGLDTINFDTGVPAFKSNADILISDSTDQESLPAITAPVVIRNNTGFAVFIQGWGGSTGDGFTFDTGSAGSMLDGLLIGDWGDVGVWLKGGSGKVTLTKNWIGVYWDGTTAVGSNIGVYIQSSNNVIGGLDGSGHARTNVISGNSSVGIFVESGAHNIIQGNYIGTTADGLSGLGGSDGIDVSNAVATQVGGMLPNQGNVISGNTSYGMVIDAGAHATKIQRNFFGVGSDGVTLVVNNIADVLDDGGLGTVIGGAMPQAGNIIASATHGIFLISPATTITITGNLIGVGAHGEAAGNIDGITFGVPPAKTIIAGNLISNNDNGINFQNTTPVVSITQNCIAGNINYGVITSGGLEKVASNWWGVSTGPNTTGGDHTNGSLTPAPWLTVPPSSCVGWAPKTINPKDQSFKNVSTKVTKFSWSPVSTAHNYHFRLSHNSNLSSPIDNFDTGLATSRSFGPLDYGDYYWQTTTDTVELVEWPSPIHAFYVTTMTSPKPEAVLTSSTVTLKWLAYPGAPNYNFWIYDTADCTLIPEWDVSVYVGTSTSRLLSASGPHSWRVQPNVIGAPIMPCWSFTSP